MKTITITKKTEQGDVEFSVNEWPETLAEMQDVWGEEITRNLAHGAAVIAARTPAVAMLSREESPLTISQMQKEMATWKPATKQKVSKVEKLGKEIGNMSEADKAALLAQLQAD